MLNVIYMLNILYNVLYLPFRIIDKYPCLKHSHTSVRSELKNKIFILLYPVNTPSTRWLCQSKKGLKRTIEKSQ